MPLFQRTDQHSQSKNSPGSILCKVQTEFLRMCLENDDTVNVSRVDPSGCPIGDARKSIKVLVPYTSAI